MKKEIKKLREEIDEINDSIFKLLEERLEKSKAIGEIKSKNDKEIFDPEREMKIVRNVIENDYEMPSQMVATIMRTIVKEMRSYNEELFDNN